MGLVSRSVSSVAVAAAIRSTRASASVSAASAASAARAALETLSKWRQGNTPHARCEEVGREHFYSFGRDIAAQRLGSGRQRRCCCSSPAVKFGRGGSGG